MLQDIRNNSQSTAAKVVVGLIVVTFALFGVESIVGGLGGEPEVAVVNGEEITTSSYERAVESRRRQIIAQMGANADPDLIDEGLLRSTVLDGMITEKVLLLDAQEKDLYVAEAYVDEYIRNIPQFQQDGVFSNERMQALLRGAGMTLKSYKDSLTTQFLMEQVRSGLVNSAFTLESEAKDILALDRQTRDFAVTTVYKGDYLDSIAVSDETVEAHYAENKENYKKPQSVDVEYVVLDRNALAGQVSVSEEKIKALYESELESFEGEEQRDASHILVKIDDETSDEQALQKVQDLAAKLVDGESFEELAKEHSQDDGSASDGGALGLSGKGVYVSDFEDALYKLEVGQVSDPVKTEFGYHLIKLNRIEANKLPSYDEMKASLEQRLIEEEVDQLFAEKSEQLADISYSSPDLEEVSDELGLETLTLAGVNADSQHPIFSSLKVQRVLFNDDLVQEKNNSELIEVAEGKSVVFRVTAYYEPSLLSLAEVKERVRDELKAEKAAEFARSVGESFIGRVEAGEAAADVAKDMGLDWQVHEGIKRDNVMIDRNVISRVFTMKQNDKSQVRPVGFETPNGNYNVIALSAVNQGELDSVSETEMSSISGMLATGFGSVDYKMYQDLASEFAEIEKL